MDPQHPHSPDALNFKAHGRETANPKSSSRHHLQPLLEIASFCHLKEVDVVWERLVEVNSWWRGRDRTQMSGHRDNPVA